MAEQGFWQPSQPSTILFRMFLETCLLKLLLNKAQINSMDTHNCIHVTIIKTKKDKQKLCERNVSRSIGWRRRQGDEN